MATTDYLADPADLAVWLPVDAGDPKLLAALAAASSRFRGRVGHEVTLVAGDVVTLDGNGRTSLLLPVWPTVAVTQVLLDSEELVEGTDYSWSEAGLLRRLGGSYWPDRLRCLEVTYDHGWAQVPEDIAEVVVDQARVMFWARPGVQTMQTGGQTVTYAQSAAGVTAQWSQAVTKHKVRTSGDT